MQPYKSFLFLSRGGETVKKQTYVMQVTQSL